MLVETVTNRPYVKSTSSRVHNTSVNKSFRVLSRDAVRLLGERPLVTSGAFLTVLSFLTAFFSKTSLYLMPFFGIPAISLFVLEIFLGRHPDKFIKQPATALIG